MALEINGHDAPDLDLIDFTPDNTDDPCEFQFPTPMGWECTREEHDDPFHVAGDGNHVVAVFIEIEEG